VGKRFVTEDGIMRGRRPAGPNYVDRLQGSALAKERLKIVLETMTGGLRVQDACTQLGICEQRFHQLREEAMRAALAGLEPGEPGRPARMPSPAEAQVRVLEERLADLDIELSLAKARAEIAVTLPAIVQPPEPEKKTRGRPKKPPRHRPPGKRKHT
jgi:transposase-like protein